jgi:twitching motility protein PilT
MNQSLCSLFQKRLISLEEALGRSSDPDELKQMISNPSAGMQRRAQTR